MTPWALRIIIANVVMYFLIETQVLPLERLALNPSLLLAQPWTAVTYMFLHGGLGHIFFNMLGLFFFGPRVEAKLGGRRFVTLYLVAGLAGALGSVLFSPRAWVVGASAALYGIMWAFAKYWPRDQIYIWGVVPVQARILVLLWAAIDLFGGISGQMGGRSNIAHFAHLGGFVGAWLYLLISDRRATAPAREWKAAVTAPAGKVDVTRVADIDMSRVHEINREELNRILDKISSQGMGSLTGAEKTFLSHFAGKSAGD
jgi:membrane associated rhomboid family serine protease